MPTSGGTYIASCLAVIALAVVAQALKALSLQVEARWEAQRRASGSGGGSGSGSGSPGGGCHACPACTWGCERASGACCLPLVLGTAPCGGAPHNGFKLRHNPPTQPHPSAPCRARSVRACPQPQQHRLAVRARAAAQQRDEHGSHAAQRGQRRSALLAQQRRPRRRPGGRAHAAAVCHAGRGAGPPGARLAGGVLACLLGRRRGLLASCGGALPPCVAAAHQTLQASACSPALE